MFLTHPNVKWAKARRAYCEFPSQFSHWPKPKFRASALLWPERRSAKTAGRPQRYVYSALSIFRSEFLLLTKWITFCLSFAVLKVIQSRNCWNSPTLRQFNMQATILNFPSYRSDTLCQYFVSLHSQNTSQSLAKLQVFASHPVFALTESIV